MIATGVIESNLSDAARKAIEMQPGWDKFFSAAQRRNFQKGRAEGEAKGRAEGKAEALLWILMQRGLVPTAHQRSRIIDCTDVATLEGWLDRSLAVGSLEELLASPAPASRPGNGRGKQSVPANGRRRAR